MREEATVTHPKQVCCSLAHHQEATSSTSLKVQFWHQQRDRHLVFPFRQLEENTSYIQERRETKGCVSVQDENFFVQSECVRKGRHESLLEVSEQFINTKQTLLQ